MPSIATARMITVMAMMKNGTLRWKVNWVGGMLILILGLSNLSAQDPIRRQHEQTSQVVDSMLGFRIAPLDTLLEWAVRNSTEMAGHRAYLRSRGAYLQKINREWMKMFQPIINVQYSNGSIASTYEDPNQVLFSVSNRQNLWYTGGFTVRFTAEDFLNRRKRAEVVELEMEKIYYEGKTQERIIRERVIMRYEAMMMAAQVMYIKARQFRTNQVAYELAERAFQQGNMSYPDYNGALEARLYSEIQYINTRSDFQKQYLLLQEVVGQPLY